MTRSALGSRPARRRVRTSQRTAHLGAAAVLVLYVYASPILGGGFTGAVRWVVVPVAAASGLALWKWPRLRTRLQARLARRDA